MGIVYAADLKEILIDIRSLVKRNMRVDIDSEEYLKQSRTVAHHRFNALDNSARYECTLQKSVREIAVIDKIVLDIENVINRKNFIVQRRETSMPWDFEISTPTGHIFQFKSSTRGSERDPITRSRNESSISRGEAFTYYNPDGTKVLSDQKIKDVIIVSSHWLSDDDIRIDAVFSSKKQTWLRSQRGNDCGEFISPRSVVL
jgi:hypothetical protein